MLQQEILDNYIIVTGEIDTVREFEQEVLKVFGVNIVRKGRDQQEKGYDPQMGH